MHGLLYLLHPGPSLVVSATFVAATALAQRAAPSPLRIAQLVALMLPMQFAIGVMNDVADITSDAMTKPYKPIPRGAVSRSSALGIAVGLMVVSVAAAASISWPVLGLTICGGAAGIAYDLGLRRTVVSALPWWLGMLVLPLAAFAAAGRFGSYLWPLVPLTLLIALALHCANGIPDVEADCAAGRAGLPARLGRQRSCVVMAVTMATCGALGLSVFRPVHAGVAVVVTSALVLATLAVVLVLRLERPFPVLSVVSAGFAVAWLAAAGG